MLNLLWTLSTLAYWNGFLNLGITPLNIITILTRYLMDNVIWIWYRWLLIIQNFYGVVICCIFHMLKEARMPIWSICLFSIPTLNPQYVFHTFHLSFVGCFSSYDWSFHYKRFPKSRWFLNLLLIIYNIPFAGWWNINPIF